MLDVQRAIDMAKTGSKSEARQVLQQVLEEDKDNVRAWAAMSQLSKNQEETATYLREVLRLMPGNEWALERLENLSSKEISPLPKTAQPVEYSDMERLIARQKSYVGNAVLVFFLYLLFYIPGLVTNFLYLQEANKTRDRAGVAPTGMGCLRLLLIVNFIIPVVIAVGIGLVALFGMLLAAIVPTQ